MRQGGRGANVNGGGVFREVRPDDGGGVVWNVSREKNVCWCGGGRSTGGARCERRKLDKREEKINTKFRNNMIINIRDDQYNSQFYSYSHPI